MELSCDDDITPSSTWFADRREIIREFAAYLNGPQRNSIMFLHGDGGTGKTSVLGHLKDRYCKILPEASWARAKLSDGDFIKEFASNDVKVPAVLLNFGPQRAGRELRDPVATLCSLRAGFATYKLKFPIFEFAYALYLNKTHQLTSARIPGEESDLLTEVVDSISNFKYIGLVNLLFKLGGKYLGTEFILWTRRRRVTKKQVERLEKMDETTLLDVLPEIFAKDLNTSVSLSQFRRVALLFDCYDAFWGMEDRRNSIPERRQEFDRWFRGLLHAINRRFLRSELAEWLRSRGQETPDRK